VVIVKHKCASWIAVFLALQTFHSVAAELYVSLNSSNPVSPYVDWSSAATRIQDAIDASSDGDQIWVTNGIYQAGGSVVDGDLTNRVALKKVITVRSVNGPWVTIIQGAGAINGTAAVRCAWLTNGASLIGFTLKSGATRSSGIASVVSGGGVYSTSSNALVANCVIASNTAFSFGGGAYQGTLKNCLISSNSVQGMVGGTYGANLNNCTVVSNKSYGVYQGTATNCIVYYNVMNYAQSVFSYTCTTPSTPGLGNLSSAPQFFADGVHLSITSPCLGAGTNQISGTDIFGRAWANPPSVGCAEWEPKPIVTPPQMTLTGDPVGFTIGKVTVSGLPPYSFSWLKDSVPLQDDGHFSSTQTTDLVATGFSFADAGSYQLVISNASGVTTSAVVQVTVHCVDLANANPLAPYSTWANAATNIQDAIAAAVTGEIVLVTNGVYAIGGKSMDGVITNRVAVDRSVLVHSVNGPQATIIQGLWDPVSTNGLNAVRCVWLTNQAILSGFTLRGGATRAYSASGAVWMQGGGVWGNSTNATVVNSVIVTNSAARNGGGAYRVKLVGSTIMANSTSAGTGGGADSSLLKSCSVRLNSTSGQGGGAMNCYSVNSAFVQNRSIFEGSGAAGGFLVNCTVSGNLAGGYASQSGAVANATLTNCIVYGNFTAPTGAFTNYYNSTFTYCNTFPLPPGVGNIDVDPKLLADALHLAAASPCLGAGTTNVVSGTDIDGQPWKNPPPMGCDEWQPEPVIGAQPFYQLNPPAHGLTFNVVAAGQSPFAFLWLKDGVLIQDDTHHGDSSTASMVVNNFGLDDAGAYQVVVSNAFGVVTSAVTQVIIHGVDANSANPIAPYSTWATAAASIQDAVDVASAGGIVLVTNGIYATGGKVMAGDLTNRVAVDKAITVTSVNGYLPTVIEGAWDPISTNGPSAVRCVWLADGAVLNGFTLRNGATRTTGNITLQYGGGIWCVSQNGLASNCLLTNNAAIYGGGISYGTLNNSLVIYNSASSFGGGAYSANLNNCTVANNYVMTPFSNRGGGTYEGIVRNSIVLGNLRMGTFFGFTEDNYAANLVQPQGQYLYSCTSPTKSGSGNLNSNPQFLNGFHISSTSPCRGAGNVLYTSGTDLEGEAWANPPSMGCDEVVLTNLVGPLGVNISTAKTNLLINRLGYFEGTLNGSASRVEWSFDDGPTITNAGLGLWHKWTNAGDYAVTFAAFNADNPAGVSTNLAIHVLPIDSPWIHSVSASSNDFLFQFAGQVDANYFVQYTTNLAAPATWQTLKSIYSSPGQLYQITDPMTNEARFYRVLAQ
jgi:hypothetical protein